MGKNENTGIRFEKIDLLDCHMSNLNPKNNLAYDLTLKFLEREIKEGFAPEENGFEKDILSVIATFDAFGNVDSPPMSLECTFWAVYRREQEAQLGYEDLKNYIVITHMLPFVREFISNMTWRTPLPRLSMPPTNARALLNEYYNATEESSDD